MSLAKRETWGLMLVICVFQTQIIFSCVDITKKIGVWDLQEDSGEYRPRYAATHWTEGQLAARLAGPDRSAGSVIIIGL